ncbi:hypothetical protein QML39_30410, partial [Klebsiella pneumoniae]
MASHETLNLNFHSLPEIVSPLNLTFHSLPVIVSPLLLVALYAHYIAQPFSLECFTSFFPVDCQYLQVHQHYTKQNL